MNLKTLTNKALDAKVTSIAKQEKELLAEAILHIAEVERRKLYCQMNITSLYAYLTKHAGFSGGSAYRLMDAARLQLEAPDLASKIENGQINMNQVRLVQEASRQSQRESQTKVNEDTQGNLLSLFSSEVSFPSATTEGIQNVNDSTPSASPEVTISNKADSASCKADLLNSIEGLSGAETEKLVAKSFDLKLKKPSKVTRQKDGTIVVQMSFTAEQWAEIENARDALSTTLPSGSYPDVIAHLAKKENQKRAKQAKPRDTTETLTPAKKKAVLQRDGCCQSRDRRTGEICGSKFNLQVDHIIPRWAGGDNSLKNLQALCAAHNRIKYEKEAGIRRC